jgi:hypothetical protein
VILVEEWMWTVVEAAEVVESRDRGRGKCLSRVVVSSRRRSFARALLSMLPSLVKVELLTYVLRDCCSHSHKGRSRFTYAKLLYSTALHGKVKWGDAPHPVLGTLVMYANRIHRGQINGIFKLDGCLNSWGPY